jgi:hypothetical protein
VILSLLLTLFYIGLSIDYKTDNLVILLQTLALFLFSIDIRLLETNYYEVLYGFRWIVGKFTANYSNHFGDSMIGNLSPVYPYVENAFTTSQLLVIKDANIIRNCLPLFLITVGFFGLYVVGGVLFMRMQMLVCWKCVPREMKYESIVTDASN